MQNAFGPFVSLYQSQLAASRRFADAMFAGTEKIDRAMIGATHRAVTEQLDLVQTLAASNYPGEFGSAFRSSLLSRNSGTALDYQKELMEIVSEVQSDLGRSFQDYVRELGTPASNAEATPRAAPAPASAPASAPANNAMLNPVTSMFSMWESAFKEVAALAKQNMMTAGPAQSEAARALASTAAAIAAAGARTAMETPDGGAPAGDSVIDGRKERNAHPAGNSRRK